MRTVRLGVAILWVLTTLPLASRAESAEPDIKVLLLAPRQSTGVPVDAASDLEQNIRMSGSVVPVDALSKADVLVELSRFNRRVKQGGDFEFLWEGHFVALLPSPGTDRFVPKPEPFTIRMIGPDESSKRKAAEALGRILAEALGRAPRHARGTI